MKKEAENADRAVATVLEAASKRGKYNSYTFEQKAAIGKYAFENGATAAVKHYSKAWDMNVSNQPLGD